MKPFVLLFLSGLAVAAPAVAQDRIPLGTLVGHSPTGLAPAVLSGYDDGGRRDPFTSLIVPKKAAASSRPRAGLASLSMADVSVKGIVRAGATIVAILEGPDGKSFVARRQDKLQDAVVKSIDVNGVVFVEQVVDALGVPHARDVRKALRPPSSEVAR